VPGGRVIIVNGPSGAGKSTLMRALQSAASFPLVVLDEPEQVGTVQPGYMIWRDTAPSLHRGYLAGAAALAREGNHVALSAGGHAQDELLAAFDGIPVVTVGLTCDIEVLSRRERRTGRWAGIAAASLGAHRGWAYDLQFDTTDNPDAGAIAVQVLTRLRHCGSG
jgi:chloramphenicol 3-O-phosphotransferase